MDFAADLLPLRQLPGAWMTPRLDCVVLCALPLWHASIKRRQPGDCYDMGVAWRNRGCYLVGVGADDKIVVQRPGQGGLGANWHF